MYQKQLQILSLVEEIHDKWTKKISKIIKKKVLCKMSVIKRKCTRFNKHNSITSCYICKSPTKHFGSKYC